MDIEVRVATTVEAAWHALRDPWAVQQWHGWEYDGLAGEIKEIFFDDVVEDADEHVLVVAGGDRFTVSQADDGVLVTLTRAPLSGVAEEDAYYDEITEGWTTFLQQLRFALERHPGEERRTVYVDKPVSADELGLVWSGDRYTAPSLGLAGGLWFRTPRQLGLTVDAWGDGLLVLAGGSATLTTYGLSAAALDELGRGWG